MFGVKSDVRVEKYCFSLPMNIKVQELIFLIYGPFIFFPLVERSRGKQTKTCLKYKQLICLVAANGKPVIQNKSALKVLLHTKKQNRPHYPYFHFQWFQLPAVSCSPKVLNGKL